MFFIRKGRGKHKIKNPGLLASWTAKNKIAQERMNRKDERDGSNDDYIKNV